MTGENQQRLLYSSDSLKALEVPEMSFYLEPYIPTEGLVLLFGKPSTFKTTLIYSLANAIASGNSIWNIQSVLAAPVLVVELDSPLQVIRTRFAGVLEDGVAVDTFFSPPGGLDFLNGHGQQAVESLKHYHREKGYKVVFVDTLRRIHSLKDSDSETPSLVYGAVQRVFPGATVVMVHHSRKSGANETDEMRDEDFAGSQQWIAQVQVAIKVALVGKDKVLLKITKTQVSEKPAEGLRLQLVGQHMRLEGEAKADEVGEILATLSPDLTRHDMDAIIADRLGVCVRTAATRRLAWQKAHGQAMQIVAFPGLHGTGTS